MLKTLLPGQATLKTEDAPHIAPRTGHTKDRGCSTYCSQDRPHSRQRMLHILLPGQAILNVEDAQHIAPRTGHTTDRR